jgi:RNA polymerase sigma-70 factor (TIGR02960 family)
MTHMELSRARAGDEQAFRELTEPYCRELHLHCYRILGSVQDAEDLVQETLLAAWRGLDRFEERASLRAWLYRIATNRCLNALRDSSRRPRRMELPSRNLLAALPEPTRRGEPLLLEPYPDTLLEGLADPTPGPEARYEMSEAVGLAFVAALQQLPPLQRAVLVLRDVLGYRAAEVADMLETTEAAVKAALQRARGAVDARLPAGRREQAPLPSSSAERELVGRFARAFEVGDVDGIVALLTEDALASMPPEPAEYEGRAAIAAFLEDRFRWRGDRHMRLVPTRANGQPAFGCYMQDPHSPVARIHGVLVLTLEGDQIAAVTRFLDNSVVSYFGLPRTLRD